MTTKFSYKLYSQNEEAPNWLFGKGTTEVARDNFDSPLYNALYHDVYLAVNGISPVIQSAMKSAVPNSQAILDAMKVWEKYLDINFTTGVGNTESGDKIIAYGGWTSGLGSATTFTGSGTFSGNYAILFNTNIRYGIDLNQAQIGNWGGWVQMHELGHVLGLAHPSQPPLSNESSDLRFTFMYDPKTAGGAIDPNVKIPLTPGMQDIRDLQVIYGTSHAQDGNTTYKFTQSTVDLGHGNILEGVANANINKYVITLSDPGANLNPDGGTDTIDASGFDNTQNLYIDLRAGHFSAIGTLGTNTAVAPGGADLNGDGDPDGDTTYNDISLQEVS